MKNIKNSLNYINQIAASVQDDIPIILYTRDKLIDNIIDLTPIKCFNLDTSDNIDTHISKSITIQGNFNPQNFHADEDELKKMAELVYMKYKNKENYILISVVASLQISTLKRLDIF